MLTELCARGTSGALGVWLRTLDGLDADCLNAAGEAYTEPSEPVPCRLLYERDGAWTLVEFRADRLKDRRGWTGCSPAAATCPRHTATEQRPVVGPQARRVVKPLMEIKHE